MDLEAANYEAIIERLSARPTNHETDMHGEYETYIDFLIAEGRLGRREKINGG
jgi:hypothetical protein